MKLLSFSTFLLLLAALLVQSQAGASASTSLEVAMSPEDGLLFRATIVREVPTDGDANESKQYVVQITRVIKGCTIKTNERILVTMRRSAVSSGEALSMNTEYLITSTMSQPLDQSNKAALGNRSVLAKNVWINSRGLNQTWESVSLADKAAIRTYKNQCSAMQ
jgi:hypothetical protein